MKTEEHIVTVPIMGIRIIGCHYETQLRAGFVLLISTHGVALTRELDELGLLRESVHAVIRAR